MAWSPRAHRSSRIPTLCVALTLLAVVLAGCLSDDDAPTAADDASSGPMDDSSDAASGSGGAAGGGDGGDADPEPEPVEPAPANDTVEPEPVIVTRKAVEIEWSQCREYSTFVPTTAAAYADELPEGFEVVPSDPGGLLTDIVIWVRVCPDAEFRNAPAFEGEPATHHGEMWSAIPVTVPDGLVEGDADTDYWPITWTVDSDQLIEQYSAWGLSGFARPGTTEISSIANGDPALAYDAVFVEPDESGRWRFESIVALNDAGPAPDTVRLWVPGPNSTPGALVVTRSGGEGGGQGAGYIRQTGDDSMQTVQPIQIDLLDNVGVLTKFAPLA